MKQNQQKPKSRKYEKNAMTDLYVERRRERPSVELNHGCIWVGVLPTIDDYDRRPVWR